MSHTPVRLAIANDYEIVVTGIAGVLAPFSDRVDVVELDSRTSVRSEVDLVLYDSYGQQQGEKIDIDGLIGSSGGRLVVFSWNTQPELVTAISLLCCRADAQLRHKACCSRLRTSS